MKLNVETRDQNVETLHKLEKISMYLKGRNFRGKKILRISRILAILAKINSFFDPQKCRFAKINSREIFQNC